MSALKLMIDKKRINAKIEKLALAINQKYKNQKVIFLGVMNGSFFLMHDLMKKIDIEYDYDFLFCSSYYGGLKSKDNVDFLYPNKVDIKNKVVIILEDIVDTGTTIEKILLELKRYNPKKIEVCTLFVRKNYNLKFDLFWYGYKIKNEFIVGYGLDYNERYRNLEHVYELKID